MAGKFWTGRIATPDHAEKIVKYMAATLAIFASLGVLSFISGVDLGNALTVLLLGVLSVGLYRSRSVVAAGLWLGLAMFSALGSTTFAIYEAISQKAGTGLGVAMFPLAAIWIVLTYAAYRTFSATRLLQRWGRTTGPPAE